MSEERQMEIVTSVVTHSTLNDLVLVIPDAAGMPVLCQKGTLTTSKREKGKKMPSFLDRIKAEEVYVRVPCVLQGGLKIVDGLHNDEWVVQPDEDKT